MPLVTTKAMLLDAHNKDYAIGAFNANNLEMAQGIISAAEEENAPVIIQVSQGGINYMGVEVIASGIIKLLKATTVPIALHLDHGLDLYYNLLALRSNFTSLMFDGSQFDFQENIKKTKKIVEIAHMFDIPVEAELGKVPKNPNEMSKEDLKKYMTDPLEALEFVKKTNIDSLAISVGSMHKMKVKSADLEIDRIKKIREVVDLPLVLHGSSGVTEDSIKKSIKAGISKVNVHTYLAQHFTQEVRKQLNNNQDLVDLRKYLDKGREALKKAVIEKIRLFNSSGRATDIDLSPIITQSGKIFKEMN